MNIYIPTVSTFAAPGVLLPAGLGATHVNSVEWGSLHVSKTNRANLRQSWSILAAPLAFFMQAGVAPLEDAVSLSSTGDQHQTGYTPSTSVRRWLRHRQQRSETERVDPGTDPGFDADITERAIGASDPDSIDFVLLQKTVDPRIPNSDQHRAESLNLPEAF